MSRVSRRVGTKTKVISGTDIEVAANNILVLARPLSEKERRAVEGVVDATRTQLSQEEATRDVLEPFFEEHRPER